MYINDKNKYVILTFVIFYRDGFIPCSPQLPTLRSVSTPEEDKTRNLPTCFSTDCECRKTERQALDSYSHISKKR